MTTITREQALLLDARDPLAGLRDQFVLTAGVIYLDGNSLGVLPKATAGRLQRVVQQEWGDGLIRSWNAASWIDLPQRIGDKIGRLVGAGPGELVRVDAQDPVTVTLPSAVGNAGAEVLVKEVRGHEELITIAALGDREIDGQATVQLSGPYAGRRLVSDGARWVVV